MILNVELISISLFDTQTVSASNESLKLRFLSSMSKVIDFKSTAECRSQSWLVGCFGLNGPLRQYFSLYRAVSQREGERGEKG